MESESLGDLFDDESASRALEAWARYGGHGGKVRPLTPRWRPSGKSASGALLAAVLVTPGPGAVVVKVSAPGRRDEGQTHTLAERTAGGRLAPQVFAPWPVGDDRLLTFQSPAGKSLRDVDTMGRLDADELPDACAHVTRWLLTEWNDGLGGNEAVTLAAADLLRDELGELVARGGSALAYGSRIDGLEANTPWIRVDDLDLPNPLAMATGAAGLPNPAFDVVRGRAHGDLHLQNIMLPYREGRAQYEKFELIDPATFSQNALLSRDVATLLLSALVPQVREPQSPEHGHALLRHLVCPSTSHLDRIVPGTSRLVHAVRQACADAVTDGWYDVWADQFLLSLLATALRFSTYDDVGDIGRWWFFRLAAHAGGELLKRHEDRPRPTGRPVTAPTSAGADPQDARRAPATRAGGRCGSDRFVTQRPEELRRLEAYSRTAFVAAGHQGGSGADAQPLNLAALAVPRDLEWSLLGVLDKGGSACVTGAPGTGKTTLLWRLHRELASVPEGPRPYFLRAGDLWNTAPGAGLTLETVRAACRVLPGPAVFLFDTADLLVSDTSGRILVQELLTIAAEHSVRVLMTCREREARTLRPYVSDFALEWKQLGPYSPREQDAAIRSHARYFYAGQPEVSEAEVCRTVANAAVRGLPMREVCRAPLTLRMLFETFESQQPTLKEIDATTLYDLYWTHRLGRDQRAGDAPLPGTARPSDLSESGEALAQLMLQEGRLDLTAAEVGAGLRTPSRTADAVAELVDDVQGLVSRGVVERQGAGAAERYSYFHQTLFEYAAGRRLAHTATPDRPSHLSLLLDWLKEHPDDQFRLAVAEQALVQAGRALGRSAEACTALLTGLLAETRDGRPELHGLRAMQMRVYARLPAPDAELRRHFTPAVAALPPVLGRIYLEALPTTCHQDGARIVDELLGIWRGGHDELKMPLLTALSWLAESLPDSVIQVIDRTCPYAAGGRDTCRGTRCAPRECLWAWLLTLEQSEVYKFLAALEGLAPKRPDWVWPRLRALMTDPRRDLLPIARCLRLAARRQDWPERPYSVVRPIVRHRWGRARPGNKNGRELQAALGRLMASGWPTNGRPPSLDAVLTAAARRPEETMSYPQVRAVGELALQAPPEEVRHLLDVVEEVARPASMPLLTDALLLPLLTAEQGAVDTIGGDTPPSRTAGAEPVATAVVRSWLARNLRALDRPGPVDFAHRLAVHTWGRDLDVVTTARLVAEAWPTSGAEGPDSGRDEPGTQDGLRRNWLSDQGAAKLLIAAAAAGHPHALQALRLWRADRAEKGDVKGLSRGTGVADADADISGTLQRLLPEHPELLDQLFAGGTIDPRLDPGWLNEALRRPGADVDRRLTAALHRHADTLERLCDVTWTRDYGSAVAQQSFHLRGKLIARGVLGPPTAGRIGEILALLGHPNDLRAALLMVETVINHSPNGSLDTQEWHQLEATLRDFTRAEDTAGRTGPGRRRHEGVAAVAGRCLMGLVCRHHALDTPQRVARARASALRYLAKATQVDEVTVLGRFVERLTETAPQDAVELVNAAAGTLRALPRGKVMSLTQRWYRPVSRLVERATAEQWKQLVEGSWEGPEELLRLLIRAGIRKRTDEPAAYLLAIADSSRWPDMIRETVRVGTLLRTEGSRRRWLPPLGAGPGAP
ncbi:NACHT domain-containing protein [Streptomyces sp. NPDC001406]|uniref:NACHT domain-containing protein n=1 Tax=Streptomyces sp. NPDC001406 TaxID=3364572 RepID=UPI00367DAE4E